jgi:hypothetical protein
VAARKHEFKLFLEGVKTPCVSAQISIMQDMPATATLQIPATPLSFRIMPRTVVHLFWRDTTGDGGWRLLFEGEVVKRGFSYRSSMRTTAIMCQDMTIYWQGAYRYFFDIRSSVPDSHTVMRKFYALNVNSDKGAQILDNTVEVGNILIDAINEAIDPIDNKQGSLLGGMRFLFQTMEEINTYFYSGSNRMKLRNKIKGVHNKVANEILRQMTKGVKRDLDLLRSDAATLWGMIMALLGKTYYSFVPCPSPVYFNSKDGSGTPNVDWKNLKDGIGGLGSSLFIPEIFSSQPPRCNVFLPAVVEYFNFTEDFKAIPTRTIVRQQTEGLPTVHYAPVGLENNIRSDSVKEFMLDEELLLGVNLNSWELSSAELAARKGASDPPASGEEKEEVVGTRREQDFIVNRVINFAHHRARAEARSGNGGGEFNPFLCVGLPSAVVDRLGGVIVGDLTQATHILDFANGTAATNFTMERGRWLHFPHPSDSTPDYLKWDSEDEGLFDTNYPTWYDPSTFSDEFIGKKVYSEIFGYGESQNYGGIREVDEEGNLESLESALKRVLGEHISSGESGIDHALKFMHREIATEFETFLALGSEPSSEALLEELKEAELNKASVWAQKRIDVTSEQWQNPDGADQPIKWNAREEGEVLGPFLQERQLWAKSYNAEVSITAHAFSP